MKAIAKQHIDSLKIEKGCSLCGYNRIASALDFHHITGEKSGNISQLNGKAMLREAKKCIVLCSTCHREVHAGIHSLKPLYKKLITQDDLGFIEGKWEGKRLELFRHNEVDKARDGLQLMKNGTARGNVVNKLVKVN